MTKKIMLSLFALATVAQAESYICVAQCSYTAGFIPQVATVNSTGPTLQLALSSLNNACFKLHQRRDYVLYTDSTTRTGDKNILAASFDIKKACSKSE
jgi:hypothetical protein